MSDNDNIIAGCVEGKRSAQNQLYRRFAGTMFSVCLRYASNKVEAEDLLQEGFMKVYSHIGSYRNQGSFEGWMRRIFINLAINQYHSSAKRHITSVDNMEIYADEMEDENTDWLHEGPESLPVTPDKVMQLIQHLPEGYRMVLNLYVFEGMTHKEIGNTMNISENTSKSQLSKARKYLKNQISKIADNQKKVYQNDR